MSFWAHLYQINIYLLLMFVFSLPLSRLKAQLCDSYFATISQASDEAEIINIYAELLDSLGRSSGLSPGVVHKMAAADNPFLLPEIELMESESLQTSLSQFEAILEASGKLRGKDTIKPALIELLKKYGKGQVDTENRIDTITERIIKYTPSAKMAFNLEVDTPLNGGGDIYKMGDRLISFSNDQVVVWNKTPDFDTAPSFSFKLPEGERPHYMVANEKHLVVVGYYHRKVFVWKTPPTPNKSAPDFKLTLPRPLESDPQGMAIAGNRLFIADKGNRKILFYDLLNLSSRSRPTLALDLSRHFDYDGGGGPGSIASDGKTLVISHFYISQIKPSKRIESILIWNQMPTKADQKFDLALSNPDWVLGVDDNGSGITLKEGTLWIPLANAEGERVLYWNQIPKTSEEHPDKIYDFLNPNAEPDEIHSRVSQGARIIDKYLVLTRGYATPDSPKLQFFKLGSKK